MSRIKSFVLTSIVICFALGALGIQTQAQTTTIAYHGRLTGLFALLTGQTDMRFKLYGSLDGGSQLGETIAVNDVQVLVGTFTVQLNFGANAFPGANRFVEIEVKKPIGPGYVTLTPRQPINSVAYAIRALSAASADPDAVFFSPPPLHTADSCPKMNLSDLALVTAAYTGLTKGSGLGARIDYPGYGMLEVVGQPPGTTAGLSAFSDAGIAGFYNNGLSEAHGADTVGRLVGRDLKTAMSNVDKLLYIDIFTDDDVEAQNRVTLSSSIPPDEHGAVPRIEIRHRNRSARTVRNREHLVRQAVRLLRALGATRVHRINKRLLSSTATAQCGWAEALLIPS